jgi:predicted amidohydrolase
MPLTVAIAQDFVPDSTASGVQRIAAWAAEARRAGAELLVLPEAWLPGYPIWLDVCRDVALWDHRPVKETFARYAAESVSVPGPAEQALRDIARTHGLTMIVGVSERVAHGAGAGTLYNSILTFSPGGALLNHHRKLIPTYTERMVWGVGDADGLRVVDTHAGHVGALVCWEHWMPLARQALHEQGEDMHVALWPTVHEMHQIASRQYAFEGRCVVLAAGSLARADALPAGLAPHPDRVTGPDQLVMRGGSAIIGPDGAYLAGPVFDQRCLLVATIDLSRNVEERMTLDVSGHYARPDVLSLHVRRGWRRVDDEA